jgi:hypothetical protein
MKMTRTPCLLIALPLILTPALSFAFFCPTNFTQINLGNTMEEVIAACGKPDTQDTKEKKPEGPQEWNYMVPQTVSANYMATPTQGTLRTQMTFDSSGKAINISVNGIGVGATSICGKPITLGDNRDTVKAACGDPVFVNKGSASTTSAQEQVIKVTTFIYNTNPPAKLIFENGKLTERQ